MTGNGHGASTTKPAHASAAKSAHASTTKSTHAAATTKSAMPCLGGIGKNGRR
ncbi:MAG: hypothetical protein WB497_15820 [Pseudolabrys sp.]